MSIMSNRSNALESPSINLANTMEERSLISGFNTSKNVYLKNSLNKTLKNNSSGPPVFQMSMMSGAMAEPRKLENSSEMIQKDQQKQQINESTGGKAAHVPKLLLTEQANQKFSAAQSAKKSSNHHHPALQELSSPLQATTGGKMPVGSRNEKTNLTSVDTNALAATNADS